jgi:hypothetical protein
MILKKMEKRILLTQTTTAAQKLTQQVKRNATALASKRKALAFVLAVLLRVDLEKFQTLLVLEVAVSLLDVHRLHILADQSLLRENVDVRMLKMLIEMK